MQTNICILHIFAFILFHGPPFQHGRPSPTQCDSIQPNSALSIPGQAQPSSFWLKSPHSLPHATFASSFRRAHDRSNNTNGKNAIPGHGSRLAARPSHRQRTLGSRAHNHIAFSILSVSAVRKDKALISNLPFMIHHLPFTRYRLLFLE